MKTERTNSLKLRKQSIRMLTTDELSMVNGGNQTTSANPSGGSNVQTGTSVINPSAARASVSVYHPSGGVPSANPSGGVPSAR